MHEPVEWGNVSYRQSQLGDPDTRSGVMSAKMPVIAGIGATCIGSIRTAGNASELFRVWWSSRSDSNVVLWMQRSGDQGRTWQAPVEVESRDRGRRACDRPAPGIFYDPSSGYVHLVYFIEGSDGAGVFFAHSMDQGGMFHSPVPVVYGNSPSSASVAAHGDSVVVVFEDPNSTRPTIGIVLSHVTGHIFDQRAQVTPDDVLAIAPWVAVDHNRIRVWWKTPDDSVGRAERVGYRDGIWR
ncbi:MAG TPA: sialidase family protein [Gemmatimonadaceae bacterium]|nr:sialidase family protein [Gemmatimonadaceae bacterium]